MELAFGRLVLHDGVFSDQLWWLGIHAGNNEIHFRLTTVKTIQRPLLGRISRLKSTAARASLVARLQQRPVCSKERPV